MPALNSYTKLLPYDINRVLCVVWIQTNINDLKILINASGNTSGVWGTSMLFSAYANNQTVILDYDTLGRALCNEIGMHAAGSTSNVQYAEVVFNPQLVQS